MNSIKSVICLISIFLMLLIGNSAFAQCNNLTLSLTKTNSTCLANGTIKITVSGPDAANIRQSDMQFQVSGDKDIAFTHYTDNTILNLPAGTYTIHLRAFCNVTNDWIVATGSATTTITTSYKEMNFSFGRIIPTLNCKPTGIIPVSIESGTGTPPFTIEVTSKPAIYTGTTTFTFSDRNYNISDLPVGSYTIRVSDDCGYTISNRTATVDMMSQDYYNLFHQYFYPAGTVANACDMVAAYRNSISSGTAPDEYYYFYSNSADYYEVAFVFNDTGTKTWQPLSNYLRSMPITLPSPHTMGSMRGSSNYVAVYLRVKGCLTEHQLPNITLDATPLCIVNQRASGCDQIDLELYPWSDYDGTICFPYEWRVVKTSDNSVVIDWQGPVANRTSQYAYNVPTGSLRVEFKDAEGYTWYSDINVTTPPKPYLSSSTSVTYSNLEPDGVYRSNVYPYFYPNIFPVGTTFKYISGPTVPTHQTGTLSTASSYIYPYSVSNFTSSNYVRMDPGTYQFEVTRPGCIPDTITASHTVYNLSSKPTYTLTEECDGMLVTFTGGGQLQYTSSTGTVTNTGTPYIRIGSTIPSSIVYDNTKVVTHGGSLKLPVAGTYIIYLGTSNSSTGTAIFHDTIVYTPTPFTLDNAVTSHYLCQGESTGFIRVKGAGGTGGYKYELYDNNVLKQTNITGVFNYGVGGGTYTVMLYDTICGYSYPQDVTLIDLGIAQIAYSSSPDNKYCVTDSIYLKCLTLGETTYTWTGPGIDNTNSSSPAYKNKQNPTISASDVGIGTHTYTITVTPESCGTEMTQTVTITVEDCSGAQDDYATLFVNTFDTINVLANDAFPSSCSGSVGPLVTVGPTQGTYTVVNKKIVYKPNTGFIGKDSLTYSTACSSDITYAKVYINVIPYPDNIVDADCYITPQGFEWGINLHFEYDTVCVVQSPFVGDFDGDGYTDIFVMTNLYKSFTILKGPDFTTSIRTYTPQIASSSEAIARVKWDEYNDSTIIVLMERSNNLLHAYDYKGNLLWTSNKAVFNPTYANIPNARAIGFADFNNDGYAEVYVGNQIFDAVTGVELCSGGSNNKGLTLYSNAANGLFSIAQNIIGDEKLELCAGNQVYSVNIASRTNVALNSMSVIKEVIPTYNSISIPMDGATVVADFDNDGELEILVQTQENATSVGTLGYLYIWKPSTQKIMVMHQLIDAMHRNVPFVGDINGDGKLELVVLSTNGATRLMRAFAINGNALQLLWSLTHNDTSGSTGLTLFDFNQDGISEIVYRDETDLRIINGSLKSHITGNDTTAVYNLYSTPAYSGTIYEYPVVADIDGDGQAEILVTSALNPSDRYNDHNSTLKIYKGTALSPWAPSRKVWNQYMYNVVNVNEDLTIPKIQMSPAMVFPGDDGILGTADDVRPYNAFLQQQTALNKNGTPLWLTPNGEVTGVHAFDYDKNADSLTVTIEVCNIGDAAFQAPFYITTYKNSIGSIPKYTIAHNQAIYPGETVSIMFGIPNFTQNWYPFNQIIIQINDNGNGDNDQAVCDDANRFLKTTNIIASDDRMLVFTDDVNRPIEVTFNDILPVGCTNPTIQVLSTPSYTGAVSVSGSDILYTPAAGVTADTLRYHIHCGDASKADTATVFISIVPKPDNISDADCYITPPAFDFNFNPIPKKLGEGNIHCYSPAVGGDIDGDGLPELFAIGTTTGDTWYGANVFVFMGTGETKKITRNTSVPGGSIALGKVKTALGDTTLVYILCMDQYIYAYSYHQGNFVQYWKSSTTVPNTGAHNVQRAHTIGLADFNNDGYAEIYVNNSIFDAASGSLLCRASGNEGFAESHTGTLTSITTVGDFDDDGKLELAAGNTVWKVNIDRNLMTGSMTVFSRLTLPSVLSGLEDGHTQVVDLDLDGKLDIIISKDMNGLSYIYAWNPVNNKLIAYGSTPAGYLSGSLWWQGYGKGVPFIGDIDGDKSPEIILLANKIAAFKYDGTQNLSLFWELTHTDTSFGTGMTLFDFNQDSISEIVYRDMTHLRIIDGSVSPPQNLAQTALTSSTLTEYPIVLDVDNDGAAEIVVSAGPANNNAQGYLAVYKPLTGSWAPARRVWNQYMYNAVNVNEDLTIPKYQLNPAAVFPGDDGILGTADDIRPYNAFLQQQTTLSKDGVPIWLTPDVYPDPLLISSSVVGDSVSITVGIINQGDAAIGSPVYVSLYKESVSAANYMITDSADIQIHPGGTGYVTVRIPDMTLFPAENIVIRVNDNGIKFAYQPECDDTNNIITIQNPGLSLYMKKDATLLLTPPVQHNGTHPNPVSVLFSENIKYEITAMNVSMATALIQIRDTLPAYLKYNVGSENPATNFVKSVTTSGVPDREILTWTVPGVAAGASTKVSFEATPVDGSCASQPLYINKAWVTFGVLQIPTANSTYHQGAGIGVATFSAGLGGQLFNAEPQAVDYRTSARTGVLIVPDEGYRFDGWSHEDYTSLRGDRICAQKGIMYYDTLTILGNVDLQACFSPEVYSIHYFLNGAVNAPGNPETYTVESGMIALEAPEKAGDVFIGWTGSNSDAQPVDAISQGSTGDLKFYANFLYSGRESDSFESETIGDKIWAVKDELFVYTLQTGSLLRIYSPNGLLIREQEIETAGETKLKLSRGIYIVTLNNNIGQKVRIE